MLLAVTVPLTDSFPAVFVENNLYPTGANVNVLLAAIVADWLNVNNSLLLSKETTVVPTGIVVPLVDDVTINPGIISVFDDVNVTVVKFVVAIVVIAVVGVDNTKLLVTVACVNGSYIISCEVDVLLPVPEVPATL